MDSVCVSEELTIIIRNVIVVIILASSVPALLRVIARTVEQGIH